MASIKYIVKDGNLESLQSVGSVMDLVSMVTLLISALHHSLKNTSPARAKAFRELVQAVIADTKSPAWNPGAHAKALAIVIDLGIEKNDLTEE